MNLLSEAKGASAVPPAVVANVAASASAETASVSARLEYRALGENELQVTYPRTGERRRMERRAQPQNPGVTRALSDDAWREAVRAARAEGVAQGEREGRGKARAEMETEMQSFAARERGRIAATIEEFAEEKTRYFGEIEGQVVRLALAIAARVLHRETQMDALVLGGAVRVALDKLADKSGVVLRAALADVPAWDAVFAAMEMTARPKVMGDAMLQRGDCVLETAMGTVELGIETQLEEIEKGFFDLLRMNPAVRG